MNEDQSSTSALTLAAYGDPLAWIGAWARSSALARVVTRFGGQTHDDRDLGEWLDYLEDFSTRWDFRGGQERNLAEARNFGPEIEELVLTAAERLGLRGTTAPGRDRYEHIVILGGLVRACLARPKHAAALLAAGTIACDRVVGLGGFRELRGDEVALVRELLGEAPVSDEYEAMSAGVEAAFRLKPPVTTRGERSETVGASWAVADYVTDSGMPVNVAAAPSSEPGVRRANTPDTYAWLAGESGWLDKGDHVLLVTTSIYTPFQGADAYRMLALPHGVEVDIIGIEPGDVDPRLEQQFAPHNYLQEMRSAIRSLRMLHAAIAN